MTSIPASALKLALSQVADVAALLRDGVSNIPDDEAVAGDVLADIALADPALAPAAAIVAGLIPIIELVVARNESALPGASIDKIAGGDNTTNSSRGR
jgi:hypothetical protein